jgi:hypothetical protein
MDDESFPLLPRRAHTQNSHRPPVSQAKQPPARAAPAPPPVQTYSPPKPLHVPPRTGGPLPLKPFPRQPACSPAPFPIAVTSESKPDGNSNSSSSSVSTGSSAALPGFYTDGNSYFAKERAGAPRMTMPRTGSSSSAGSAFSAGVHPSCP